MVIPRRGGIPIHKTIRLRELATVEKGLDDIHRLSRVNGKPAVGLGIKKQRGTNAVNVAQAIRAKLKKMQGNLPEGYLLRVSFDSTKFIEESTHEMQFTMILSIVLTSLVCLLVLGSWGSTFNIALAIPTSIMGSFFFIYLLGFTLNTFTMLALILAIGIVVDDAIIVLENIVRHREMGKSALKAAADGTREIISAAIATTIALIAIFIPVVFMKGVIGYFFFQFGVVLSIAVAISLLEAVTLTPMRCSKLLRHDIQRTPSVVDRIFVKLHAIYSTALTYCLKHRWQVVAIACIIWLSSMALLPNMRKELVPPQDQSMFLITKTPIGSSLELTDNRSKQAEAIIMHDSAVKQYYSAVGGFEGGSANSGIMFVSLKEPESRPKSPQTNRRPTQQEVMARLRKQLNEIPDLQAFIIDLSMNSLSSGRGFPVEFTVRGPDWEKLTGLADKIIEKMKTIPGLTDINTDYEAGQPEMRLIPNRNAAALYGVDMATIGNTIGALMGGIEVGKFIENGHRNDIRIQLPKDHRRTAADLQHISLRNSTGEIIPLAKLVTIKQQKSLQSITRIDRERAVGITANLLPGTSQHQAIDQVKQLASVILPPDYRIVVAGSSESMNESFQGLLFAMLLGIVVSYMVLGSQYNSFLHPIAILSALPFSISGALIALRLFDQSLNIFSLIGMILLLGIVKKNSILLVDFTNQLRTTGLNTRTALLTACPQRLRPIALTSFATIAAALPPALGIGPGAETRVPMALSVIGGVLFSTIMTLLVVPCIYSLLTRLEVGHHGD